MPAHARTSLVPTYAPRSLGERAFSLIEVIIAMTILSIVVSGAALAVVSSDSVETKAKAVADSHAIAEKAVERLRNDLSAQAVCNTGGGGAPPWVEVARAVKTAPTPPTTETNFAVCRAADYNDIRDSKGRRYLVSLDVEARDLNHDGFGASDTDGDLRDSYDVKTTVRLAPDSMAGRESSQPITVAGTVDWEGGTADDGTITVVACAIDRPDRALVAGGCASGDPSRRPVPISVTAFRVNEETGGVSAAGTISSGAAPAALRPGAYRFTAPGSVAIGPETFTLFKLDPADLRVAGSQNYTIHATYVRNAMTTTVCTQIVNYVAPHDDGYEVLETNLHLRRTGQPGFVTDRLRLNANRSWNCTGPGGNMYRDHLLSDPVNGGSLYRGLYDLEVDQVARDSNGKVNKLYTGLPWDGMIDYYKGRIPSLYVQSAALNCSLVGWNNPNMGGSALINRGHAGSLERPDSNNPLVRSAWRKRMAITATSGPQRLCLRFYSKQIDRQQCNPGQPGCIYKTCALPKKHKGFDVVDDDTNCWNGAEVCVANCDKGGPGGPKGNVSNNETVTENAGISGGPIDGTVGCTTKDDYFWIGSRKNGDWDMPDMPMSTILSYRWIGGSDYYYDNYAGRALASHSHPYPKAPGYTQYPSNPVYHCTDVYFTATKDLLMGEYPLYTCLQVYVPGRNTPDKTIRGLVLDQSGTSGGILYTTVGGGLGLAPDSPRMQNHWNPQGNWQQVLTGSIAWPKFRVKKVTGDPVCNSGGGPVYEHVDPIITYWRIYNDPRIAPLSPPGSYINLTTDKLGV